LINCIKNNELEGKYRKQFDIIELWNAIINSQIEQEHHICVIKTKLIINLIKRI